MLLLIRLLCLDSVDGLQLCRFRYVVDVSVVPSTVGGESGSINRVVSCEHVDRYHDKQCDSKCTRSTTTSDIIGCCFSSTGAVVRACSWATVCCCRCCVPTAVIQPTRGRRRQGPSLEVASKKCLRLVHHFPIDGKTRYPFIPRRITVHL